MGYINKLEQRLLQTEIALYDTLTELRKLVGSRTASISQHDTLVQTSALKRSKRSQMEDWDRLPLHNGQQLEQWWMAKRQEFSSRVPATTDIPSSEKYRELTASTDPKEDSELAGYETIEIGTDMDMELPGHTWPGVCPQASVKVPQNPPVSLSRPHVRQGTAPPGPEESGAHSCALTAFPTPSASRKDDMMAGEARQPEWRELHLQTVQPLSYVNVGDTATEGDSHSVKRLTNERWRTYF